MRTATAMWPIMVTTIPISLQPSASNSVSSKCAKAPSRKPSTTINLASTGLNAPISPSQQLTTASSSFRACSFSDCKSNANENARKCFKMCASGYLPWRHS